MRTRVKANHFEEIRVRYGGTDPKYRGHWIAIRFRPDQRKFARMQLIKCCFLMAWVIPLDHWAFTLINQRTWEPVK